jgi:hypothetical protein
MGYEHHHALIDLLSKLCTDTGCKLFAVLDGARHEDIYLQVRGAPNKAHCLYSGSMTPELESAAPWLVELDEGHDAFSEYLAHEGYGESWGVFFLSKASMRDLRKHFRKFLLVKREDGTKLYFRYYDPRVLRVYLPTCDADELSTIFGPVEHYVLEGRQPSDSVAQFTNAGGQLRETLHELVTPAAQDV